MSVILCYGDSNTHGTRPAPAADGSLRYPREDRWPDVMAAHLGSGHQVIAEGLPSRTTVHEDRVEGGVRNGLAVLPAILHSHKPIDLLLLMLGTNDLKPRYAVNAYEIALSVMRLVHCAQAEGVVSRTIVIAPAPVAPAGEKALKFIGAEARQQGLEGHLRDMALAEGVGFVAAGDTVTVAPADGIHWSAQAHQAFGAAMTSVVRTALA